MCRMLSESMGCREGVMLKVIDVKCPCGNVLFTASVNISGVTGGFECLACGEVSKFIHSLNPRPDDPDVEAAIRSTRISGS
jgi:hypothetical protein